MIKYPFMCGNWKMYKTTAEAKKFAEEFKALYHDTDVKAAVCAPFTQLEALVEAFKGTGIGVGAQNCFYEKEGAFTGEISIPMLEELGVDYCIVGHSERRQYFNETDETVNRKLKALLETEIRPILCVGESLSQREEGIQNDFVSYQIRKAFFDIPAKKAVKVIVAYEPIWAIGTGRTATPEQAGEMCGLIRDTLIELYGDEIADDMIIQYGGSVKPENITEIMAQDEVDGALIGGASLKAQSLMEIVDF